MVGSNFRSFTPRSAKRLRGRHLSGKMIFILIEFASVKFVFLFVLALKLLTSGRRWTGCLLPVWDGARSSPLFFFFFSQPVPVTHTAWHKRWEYPIGICFGSFLFFFLCLSAFPYFPPSCCKRINFTHILQRCLSLCCSIVISPPIPTDSPPSMKPPILQPCHKMLPVFDSRFFIPSASA